MKKTILSTTALLSMWQAASASDTIYESLQNGKFSVNARLFYFDRDFDTPDKESARALTAGGIIKYESAAYHGLKAGFAYYGSHRLGNLFSREEGSGTSILGRSGEDLSILGEAYLEYNLGSTMLKAGRQRLATPLMNDHDLRLLPSSYAAIVLRNTDLPGTMIEAGHVTGYTGFTSKDNNFLDHDATWGEEGLAYVYVKNDSIDHLTLKGQYILPVSDEDRTGAAISIEDYRYVEAVYKMPAFGTESYKSYVKAQYGGNSYADGDTSHMYGMKIGTSVSIFDFALLSDKITDNNFKAVEAGPMYSDWQQGYGPYEPSTAYGGQIIAHPLDGLSVKVGYVDVSADEESTDDDFSETNLDIKYAINNYSKLRVRYSIKDQTESSSRDDQDDFRVIYYINF
jgi:imipenem/basic amino acid-specific outer membrane pore